MRILEAQLRDTDGGAAPIYFDIGEKFTHSLKEWSHIVAPWSTSRQVSGSQYARQGITFDVADVTWSSSSSTIMESLECKHILVDRSDPFGPNKGGLQYCWRGCGTIVFTF